ncbi:MAG: ABC transporter permease [bacterium]
MIKILWVTLTEAKSVIRRKSYVIFNFILPIVLISVLIQFTGKNDNKNIHINSDSQTGLYSIGIVNNNIFNLEGVKRLDYGDGSIKLIHFWDRAHAIRFLENGIIREIYTLEGIKDGTYIIERMCPNTSSLINLSTEIVRTWLIRESAMAADQKIKLINPPVSVKIKTVEISGGTEDERLLISTFIFILVFLTLMTSGYLFQSIVAERNLHLLENILGILNPHQFIWGKLLGTLAAGTLPVIFWIPILAFAISDRLPWPLQNLLTSYENLLLLLPLMVLSILVFSTLLMIAVILGSGPREGQQLATLLIITVILTLQYLLVIRGGQPDYLLMRIIALVPPFTAPLAAALFVSENITITGYLLYAGLAILYVWISSIVVSRFLKATLYLKGGKGRFKKFFHLILKGE